MQDMGRQFQLVSRAYSAFAAIEEETESDASLYRYKVGPPSCLHLGVNWDQFLCRRKLCSTRLRCCPTSLLSPGWLA